MLMTNLQPTRIPTTDIRIRNTYPLEKDSPSLLLRGFCGKFLGLCEINQEGKKQKQEILKLNT